MCVLLVNHSQDTVMPAVTSVFAHRLCASVETPTWSWLTLRLWRGSASSLCSELQVLRAGSCTVLAIYMGNRVVD